MVRVALAVLSAGVLSSCGTASFSNAYSVAVTSPQQVSVFDSQMGQSREWAQKTMGTATPDAPYTTQLPATDTKFIGDDSPPTSLQAGVYLPARTESGYYALSLNDAQAGVSQVELPFVAWYSPDPVPAQAALPVDLTLQAGSSGWLVTVKVRTS